MDTDRITSDLIHLLREGKAVEIYTTISGRVRAGSVVEPTVDCWRADDYAFGFACAICGEYRDEELHCGHYVEY